MVVELRIISVERRVLPCPCFCSISISNCGMFSRFLCCTIAFRAGAIFAPADLTG